MESTPVDVGPEEGGQRLDRFLADRLGISRARVRHLLEVGRVELADQPLAMSDKSRQTEAGEHYAVSGALRVEDERPIPRPDLDLSIVKQGPGWIVIDKPAGCGVHPLRPDQDDTVLNALIAREPEMLGLGEGGLRSGVVHRLDVDTTGALAFATDAQHWKRLRGAFTEHRVDKRYLALVAGRFEERRRVELYLAVTRHQPAHVEVRNDGRSCRLRVEPVQLFEAATLIEVRLETGFLHQIRATMAHLGHPVLGDSEYGGTGELDPTQSTRQMLHAARLSVDEIRVEVPLPPDFQAAVDALAGH